MKNRSKKIHIGANLHESQDAQLQHISATNSYAHCIGNCSLKIATPLSAQFIKNIYWGCFRASIVCLFIPSTLTWTVTIFLLSSTILLSVYTHTHALTRAHTNWFCLLSDFRHGTWHPSCSDNFFYMALWLRAEQMLNFYIGMIFRVALNSDTWLFTTLLPSIFFC